MPDTPYFHVADAAKRALPNSELGNKAAEEARALVDRILEDPNLGPDYLHGLLQNAGIEIEDTTSPAIMERLLTSVKDGSLEQRYLWQLLFMAATHPAVHNNPDIFRSFESLERLAIDAGEAETPQQPTSRVAEREGPRTLEDVTNIRKAGL